MIGMSAFSTTAKKFVGRDIQALLATTQHTEGGLRTSLASLTADLDEAMRSGASLQRDLGSRREFAQRLLTNVSDGNHVGQLDYLPPELKIAGPDGSDAIEAVITQLRAEGSKFDSAADAAMDGVLLLDKSNPDALVERLKSSSSFWANDMIRGQGDEIERLLRSERPVSATAGSLLGHPIATAKIPVGSTHEGISHTDIHLIPDRVVSPPQGFSSLDDAQEAAINFIQGAPGNTAIAVRDGEGAYHLLAAPTDTAKRTITVNRKLRGATEKHLEVKLRANHPHIDAIFRSDNTLITKGQSGFSSGSWPEGHLWPGSSDWLKTNGYAKPHQAISTKLQNELHQIDIDEAVVAGLNNDLAAQRRVIRDQRMQAEQFSQIKDHPGEGGPATWEIEPALQYGGAGGQAVFEYSPHLDGFTKALPGFTVEDAVQLATRSEITDPSLMTAVMQDSTGTPHLAAISYGSIRSKGIASAHPDMRALYRPMTGELNFWPNGNAAEMSFLSVPHKSANDGILAETLTKHLEMEELGKNWKGTIIPYTETEPIKLLPAADAQSAADLAFEEVRGMSKQGATVLVVKVPFGGSGKEAYGMVRVKDANSGWNTGYNFQANADPKIVGAVDNTGVVFARTD